jgi:DNA-directed RNA polymerase subunit H
MMIRKMNDNFVFIDNVYRSRMNLLDILEERGYEVDKYRKFSPAEAAEAVLSFPSLSFKVTKKDDETKVCDVRYVLAISRQKLDTYFDDIEDEDTENMEVIVMLGSAITEAHHVVALKQYLKMMNSGEKRRRNLRVSFFSIYMLVVNPLHHVLVPKHEIVPKEKHNELMQSLFITSKSKFPEIKFHVDPIARCIGAVPGDIVKITRPSQASGEAIIYRVCAP